MGIAKRRNPIDTKDVTIIVAAGTGTQDVTVHGRVGRVSVKPPGAGAYRLDMLDASDPDLFPLYGQAGNDGDTAFLLEGGAGECAGAVRLKISGAASNGSYKIRLYGDFTDFVETEV